ncbi:hypothetical protein EVJ58_g5617 [Rhodofomes roseus]|uniref:Uncharacterized protein n=1 Tax=Rhodofomes roseus TaxID=34475 RepID=A0A4Y9YDR8_9APHY|nr:hypothetical protein EVJ58_g5617 [Rhodofomes roseus]
MHKSGVEHALRRVEVRNTYEWICELLLDWLFAADVAGRLQELTYEPWSKAGSNTSKLEKRMALFVCNSRDPCPPVSGTRGLARILSDPRPHLELLSFRCDPDDRCSLSNAPNLRVLTVTFNTLRSDTWRTSCDEIRHILSSISSNQLVLLTLVLPLAMDLEFRTGQAEIAELKASLPDEDTLKSFHEPLLEHPRFSRLVRVHLALMLFQASHKDYIPSHNQQAVKAMADWARRLFMPWYTRGILFVRVEELRTMWKIHFPLCDKACLLLTS